MQGFQLQKLHIYMCDLKYSSLFSNRSIAHRIIQGSLPRSVLCVKNCLVQCVLSLRDS